MIRVSVSYSRPKNMDLEMEILMILSKHFGSKLGEFGFIDNRFEVLLGFKKESQAISFRSEVLKLNHKYSCQLQVFIAKIKDSSSFG